MAVFKFVFYAILFILIKIGDFIYAVIKGLGAFFSNISRYITSPFRKILSYRKNSKKLISEENAGQHPSTMRHFFPNFFNALIKLSNFLLILIRGIARETWGFFVFVLGILFFPFRILRRKRNLREEKKVPVPPRPQTLFYKIFYFVLGGIVACLLVFLPITFYLFISDLPKLSNLSVNYIPKTTKIFDRSGSLLFEIYSTQNRTVVPLERIPQQLRQATIAIEDKDFYNHPGFDIRGILRAIYVDAKDKQLQGGSTITQQLIKSALLTPETTLIRKIKEIVLAFWAERQYTKNQILELYFNYVPYGGTAWGIEAASQVYFGKDVDKLNLAESSYLAGLPRAPSLYSPFLSDGTKGKRRQKEVLAAMVRDKYITQKQADEAYKQKLVFLSSDVPIKAPHFVMYVKELLIEKYGISEVERGGLQVTTSIDMQKQAMAEQIVTSEVEKSGYLGIGNGAALITNPKNGDILAMVGSRGYFDAEHDGNVNITTSLRQPGSTIKLLTYALALSRGYTEATVLNDTPLTIKNPGAASYTPVNYDGVFHGRVPLRIAFANSYNIPAVRTAQDMGVGDIVEFGKEMGITSWGDSSNYGVSITLGGADTTMLDLASVYGVIANLGKRVEIDPILEVKDSSGKVLLQKKVIEKEVVSPGVAFIVSDILADNKARSRAFGPNSPLVIPGHRVSVKTGTTDNKRDNWTIGFTPDIVVAAWVGNNDNTPLSPSLASGITGAAPIWNQIMTKALQTSPASEYVIPSEVVKKSCFGYEAYFIKGTEGKLSCRYQPPSITPTPAP